MRTKKIKTFYTPKQVCLKGIEKKSFSKSPLKPLLLMEYLKKNGFDQVLEFSDDFPAFNKRDFLLAHTRNYVNDFFEGGRLSETNGLPWSLELVDSVCYTNSSLYHAIRYAWDHPETLTFSPTSGFHHATPEAGMGYCTFSGQVIASRKLFQEKGLVGAYLDLDGHYGNSIPNSVSYFPDIEQAIACHINPKFKHQEYLNDFKQELAKLADLIREEKVHYVVWCHGADSHEWDDLGSQCTTEEWIHCSELFYRTMRALEAKLGRCIPVTITLFGGYRKDDYNSVLSLHASDIQKAAKILLDVDITYETKVQSRIIQNQFLSLSNERTSDQIKRA
jgi:acetoin utilization deacetylase AcuC-like enzyme